MVYYIYAKKENEINKKISCLALQVDNNNNKITGSKIITDIIDLGTDMKKHWTWAGTSKGIHLYLGFSDIPDFILPYIKLLDESMEDKIEIKEIVSIETESYKQDIENTIIMFKTFLMFSAHPEKVHEFNLFEKFKEKHGLGNEYQIEDWLIDMEEMLEKIDI